MGDSIRIEVTSERKIDSVQIISGGRTHNTTKTQLSWPVETTKTGTHKFRVKVFFDSTSETHYPRLIVLSDRQPEQYSYLVTGTYPHNEDSYTQGLFYHDDFFIESTGQKKKSSIKKVDPMSGEIINQTPLTDDLFGEGCTVYKNEVYQLTWQAGTGIVYDMELNEKRRFSYNTEGWGLTTVGDSLAMTDGSETIRYMNPRDFSEVGSIEVYTDEGPVTNLNELEYINGYIYANEYQSENIHVIDPKSGKVLKTIDMSALLTENESEKADVLNGIAYDKAGDRLFVTGKWWPWIFEIKLKPDNRNPS